MLPNELKCSHCENPFIFPIREYRRRIKKGATEFCCSKSCASYIKNKNMPEEQKIRRLTYLTSSKGRFTYYLYQAKARKQYGETDLDENYLSSIWTNKCNITNIPILLKNKSRNKMPNSIYNASLDRIDTSKGYIKGNVQFVALGINFAKNGFSNDELIKFINDIKTI